jgi:hypothetical protein
MVLRLKPRESRTLPGLPRAEKKIEPANTIQESPAGKPAGLLLFALKSGNRRDISRLAGR